MPELYLTKAAVGKIDGLSPVAHKAAQKLMKALTDEALKIKPVRVRSHLLGTSLFLLRVPLLRILYEMNNRRAIILAVHELKPPRGRGRVRPQMAVQASHTKRSWRAGAK